MSATRFIKQGLIGLLALVGAAYMGIHAFMWLIFPNGGTEIVSSIPAPDGQHKAVIFFWAGPALAPGFHQYVGIIATAQADGAAWADRNQVFRSDCGELGDTDYDMKKNVAWVSAQTLQITFDSRHCALIYEVAGNPGFRVVYALQNSGG